MELKTMKTQTSFSHLRGLKLAALAIGTSFVLAGCAGNPPTEQYADPIGGQQRGQRRRYRVRRRNEAAQDKLKQAEIAMHDKKYEQARASPNKPNGTLASQNARPRLPRPNRL
jgi:hypothetical protein